jgi:hypothetical protein
VGLLADVPAALLFVSLVVAVLYVAVRGTGRRTPRPRWVADTELRDGVTVVLVRHVAGGRELGRQVIAELPADAPDWETRYHEAMAIARSRAAALEIETG